MWWSGSFCACFLAGGLRYGAAHPGHIPNTFVQSLNASEGLHQLLEQVRGGCYEAGVGLRHFTGRGYGFGGDLPAFWSVLGPYRNSPVASIVKFIDRITSVPWSFGVHFVFLHALAGGKSFPSVPDGRGMVR